MAEGHSIPVEYRDIPDYPCYRVGNDGSVWSQWSKAGRQIGKDGKYSGGSIQSEHWTQLTPTPVKKGYLHVAIQKDGTTKHFYVNRLVLTLFVGPPPTPQHQAAHENGVRDDNRLTNLSWKTPQENNDDKIRHGTVLRGEDTPFAILTEEKVVAMRERYALGEDTVAELGRAFGVGQGAAKALLCGRNWKHAGGPIISGDQYARSRAIFLARSPNCPKGHPFDEANTRISSDGARSCRICSREATRRWYHAQKAKKLQQQQEPPQEPQ